MMEKKSSIQRNQLVLDSKKKKLEFAQLCEEEKHQMIDNLNKQDGRKSTLKGNTTLSLSNTADKPDKGNFVPGDVSVNAPDRVADWVSNHSKPTIAQQAMTTGDVNSLQAIQQRAQRMIEKKKRAWETPLELPEVQSVNRSTKPNLGSCPNSGVEHLKKLNLVPDQFAGDSDIQDTMEPQPEGTNSKLKNPLLIQTKFNYDIAVGDRLWMCSQSH